MGHTPEAEKIYRISQWKANSILIALIGMVGVVMSSYYTNRPTVDAPDRYTGTRGIAFENATKTRFDTVEDVIDTLQIQVTALEYNAIGCTNWRDNYTVEWKRHGERSERIVNEITNDITRLQEKMINMKELINQCIPNAKH